MVQARGRSIEADSDQTNAFAEGMSAGLVGALTIAVWFLILDTYYGRPFFTPNILGTFLFRGGLDAASLENLLISYRTILVFTWIHVLVFCVIGVAAAWLIRLAKRDPNFGFGIVLLCVIFEFGFVGVNMVVAETVLHALTVPAILIGNLLAIGTMSLYFWRHHPNLTIFP